MPSSISAKDRAFLMSWKCKGPREPEQDSQGESTWTLWKIHGKYTFPGRENCYGAQYWETENGKNLVYSVSVSELRRTYPEQVEEWEKEHGESWKVAYPNGNPWEQPSPSSTIVKSSSPLNSSKTDDDEIETPTSSLQNPSKVPSGIILDSQAGTDGVSDSLPQKRRLDLTPSRPRHPSFKKMKLPEDVDMDDPIEDDTSRPATPMQLDATPVKPKLQRLSELKKAYSASSQAPRSSQSSQRVVPFIPRRVMSTKTLQAHLANQARDAPKSPIMAPMSPALAASPARFQTPAGIAMVGRKLSTIGSSAGELVKQKMAIRQKLDAIDDGESDDSIGLDTTSVEIAKVYADSQAEFKDAPAADTVAAIPPSAPAPRGVYDTYSNRLIEAHEVGVEELVRVAMDLEGMPDDSWVEKRKAGSCDYSSFISYLVLMLMGSDSLILKHFVKGDLAKEAVSNSSLRRKLSAVKTVFGSRLERPVIYAQYLVDANGISPTAKQWLDVLDIAEEYMVTRNGVDLAANQKAAEIDSVVGKSFRPVTGLRRYFVDGKDHRVKVAETWIADARARLSILPPDKPLERPFAEIGYATKPTERLNQHATHTSSNYLMNLADAIFRTQNCGFKIRQFVVFELVDLTHAMYAEILYTRFGLGYTKQGGGFSHHQAGISHGGADKMPPEYWEEKKKRLYKGPTFKHNLEDELDRGLVRKAMYEGCIETAELQNNLLDMGAILETLDLKEENQELVRLMGADEEEELGFIRLLEFDML